MVMQYGVWPLNSLWIKLEFWHHHNPMVPIFQQELSHFPSYAMGKRPTATAQTTSHNLLWPQTVCRKSRWLWSQLQGSTYLWCQRFCVFCFEVCLFSPFPLWSANFKTKRALNLWLKDYVHPCVPIFGTITVLCRCVDIDHCFG